MRGLSTAPAGVPRAIGPDRATVPFLTYHRGMKSKIELSVQGMTGDGVVRNIEQTLGGVKGIEYAHVNLGAAKITVEYDDSVTNTEKLVATVARLGLHATQL